VALSGDTLVVGAFADDSLKGSAYIFVRNWGGADNWGQVKKLIASDGTADDWFGYSVAISGDTVVVGAYGDDSSKGAAYVFVRNQGGADNWGQVKKLTASDGVANDYFGWSVALSGDTIVVGAYGDDGYRGAVYVFARNQGGANNWGQVKKLVAADWAVWDCFGMSVALSGDAMVVGAFMDDSVKGAAYVFARNQGGADNWGQVKKLTASDGIVQDSFGESVAISGDTVVVGAPDHNGHRGAAYVFARNQGGADQWGQLKKLTASDGVDFDRFGVVVAISGDTVVAGKINQNPGLTKGAAYVFARNQGGADQWGQVKKLTAADGAADDSFGVSVAISGDTVVVGAYGDDSFKGAAYVYQEAEAAAGGGVYLPLIMRNHR
jgi:ribonuclease BN (tRNA processing enzyme)